MICLSLRQFQCAMFCLAFLGSPSSSAQSAPPVSASLRDAVSLPDEPSQASAAAQTTSQTQGPPGETEEQRKLRLRREEAEREVKQELKQRAGGVIPIFTVVMNGQQTAPLTAKEKFVISFHTIIDPYTIGLAAVIGGGYGELTDDHTGYGHGPAGYFKRTAASYADNVIGNVVGNSMLPVLLKQDPRYFRKGHGSIKSRILYSAMTTFICHSDAGRLQFNASNVLGNFVAGAISNAYYPADERGVSLTISNASVVTLEGMLGAQLLEFSPDFNDLLKRHRQHVAEKKAAARANPAAPPPLLVQPAASPTLPPQP